MDAFLTRKRPREPSPESRVGEEEEESTDFKLAILASLHSDLDSEVLLEALLASQGSVEQASQNLKDETSFTSPTKKSGCMRIGYQSSLSAYRISTANNGTSTRPKKLTKKGQTLHLYSPEDIEQHTPCSIIHNFLPAEEADALLLELLEEAPTYSKLEFQLFERTVKSPHTFCFYVNDTEEAERQKTEYIYDGRRVEDVRQSTPLMLAAAPKIEEAVNREIQRRIRDFYPNGQKLKYQSPSPWRVNTAFVNCYTGPQESVGYHTDQLTYLGPRAVIGSLSLGVAREFRVRKIVAGDDPDSGTPKQDGSLADSQGQISIHLPHNSLLVMHAEMQEEWKHSIAPAQTIDPHPLAGNKRLNITYRYYKPSFHPKFTPKCKCGVSTVLRCVMRKKENRGRYMWMCHVNYVPGKEGCGFFQWAEFDDDGEPPWAWEEKIKDENQESLDQSGAQEVWDDGKGRGDAGTAGTVSAAEIMK